ncbi:MAG: cohesin domain-containing protein, partial [Bacteroidota bacterium]
TNTDGPVSTNTNSGTVSIDNPIEGFTLILGDVTAMTGDNVCLPVTVNDFENILGMQFSINYDPAALTYTGVQNFNAALLGWGEASIGQPMPIGPLPPGSVTATWNDPLSGGVTLADGEVLFEICFDVTTTTTTTVTFSGMPTPIEVINTDEEEVPFNSNPGVVTIGTGGPDPVTLTLADVNTMQGSNVCLPLTVTNFTDINSMSFTVNYNSSILGFTGSQNFNASLPGWGAANITNPSPGTLTVTWSNASGITLPNGTSIVELCFDVNGMTTSDVTITNASLTNTDGAVTTNTNSGTVTVENPIEGFTLILGDATVMTGDNVCLPVTVNDFENILGMQFSINYDPAALTYTGVQNFNPALLGWGAASIGQPMPIGPLPPGSVTATWNDPLSGGVTLPDGDVLFEICFDVTTTTSTTVTFTGMPTPIEIINTDEEEVPFNSNPGVVTVGTVGPDPVSLTLADVVVMQGNNVCLPLTVTNFTDITSMSFTVNYDSSILGYTGAQNFSATLPGWGAANITNPSPGTLTVTWSNATGISLADGSVLVELCFDANGTTTSDVSISSPNLTDTNGAVTTNTEPGTVTIQTPFDGFTLIMGDATVMTGDNVCLPVTVNDFDNILGMQFSINYDPAALTYTGVQNFNPALLGWGASSIGQPMPIGPLPPGSVTATWNDPLSGGVTLADGDVLFEICFDVTTTTTTTVTFTDMPTPIEIINTAEEEVPFNSDPGIITIGTTEPGEFAVTIPTVEACNGEAVCLDLTAITFTNIQGMQFSITFNTADLSFTQVDNLNASLPGLTVASFNTSSAGTGTIIFQWDSTSGSGVDLPANAILFSLCFNKVSDNATTVTIGSTPTPIEIVDENETVIPFSGVTGQITCSPVPPLEFGQIDIVNLICADDPIGSVTIVNMVNGSGNYTYSWSVNGETGPSISGQGPGNVSVTVTDEDTGMTVDTTVTITSPPALTGSVLDIVNILCAGDNTGSITISAGGGVGPLSYDWSGDLTDNVTMQSGLPAGSYSVTIIDQNMCTLALENIQINELAPPITLSGNVTLIPGNGNPGGIDLDPQGGNGGYTYRWTGPNGYAFTGEDPNNITEVGEYCVTVEDSFGCTESICFDVWEVLRLQFFEITAACAGETNGGIDVTIAGGNCPGMNTYIWTSPPGGPVIANTEDLPDVGTGTYRLEVTDCSGASISLDFSINENDPIVITGTTMPVEVINDGSITLDDVTGGSDMGYTYAWEGPDSFTADTRDITGLANGEYTVTVTDSEGCTGTATFMVDAPALVLNQLITTEVPCWDDETGGSVFFRIGGGEPPVVLSIDGPSTQGGLLFDAMGERTVSPLPPGDYTYTITDSGSGMLTGEFTIEVPEPITAGTVTIVNDTEDPGGSGSVSISPSGGTGSLDVTWLGFSPGVQVIGVVGPVTVSGRITDSRGCELDIDYEVLQLTEEVEITNTGCDDTSDGEITVIAAGATEPYTYEWTREGETDPFSTEATVTGLAPGSYTVIIRDATGATLVRTYDVETESNYTVEASVIEQPSCFDSTNGAILAEVVNDGNSTSFTYEFVLNGSVIGTNMTGLLENLGAGEYTINVTDEFSCTASTTIGISAPAPVELPDQANAVKPISCGDRQDAEINAFASGGTAPYTYSWSVPGASGPQLTGLGAGTYSVTATDSEGCSATATYTVGEAMPLIVTIDSTPHTNADECDGTVTAVVLGGTPPYTYDWLNIPDNPNQSMVEGLCTGTYMLQVTDANGCTSSVVMVDVADERFECFEERVVITPDGNGSNDEFIIFCAEALTDNHLEIYNRWGQLVFMTDNYDNTWEGTSQNGDELPAGPYYWVLDYFSTTGEPLQRRGSLTIVRDN